MKDDPELARWAEDFRAADGEPRPSPDAILADAAKERGRTRLEWASQIGGTAFAVLVFLTLVARTRSPLFAGLAAVVLPTLVASFGVFVHLRLGAARTTASSLLEHAAAALGRAQARRRMARVSRAVLAFLTIAYWVWFPIFVLSNADRFRAQPWRLLVGGSLALVVFTASFWYVGRTVRRAEGDVARWKRIKASLGEA